ncbi:C-GCAxxG-C-C family (seleno)protein [Chloroflexota bacterium]
MHGLQKYFDFISDDIVQAAVSLSGGGARAAAGSCGAFSGGLMALSTKFSPRSEELSAKEREELDRARIKFYEFRDWFIAEFSGVTCRDVQCRLYGRFFNLMDNEERQAFRNFREVHGNRCSQVTMKTALKVAEILSREDNP